jgi:folate-binding protein YgfZ
MVAPRRDVKMDNYPQSFIVDLSPFYGIMAISGRDATTFLQGQLTADISAITSTKHTLAAYCNLKGRIHALFRLFYYQETYYLTAPKAVLAHAFKQLKRFAQFSKVTLEDISLDWQHFGLSTTGSAVMLTETPEIISLTLSENPGRFELFGPTKIMQTRWEVLTQTVEERDFNEWKLLDIQTGIPSIWAETQEKFLPHYLNLPQLDAVSFSKGCYVGQEIIARMQYRGNLKRGLYRAYIESTTTLPAPGTSLVYADTPTEERGTVVSAAVGAKGEMALLIEAPLINEQSLTLYLNVEGTLRPVGVVKL